GLHREMPGGFKSDLPAGLEGVCGMQPEAVARQVQDLGIELAGLTIDANAEFRFDARISGKPVLPGQNRFVLHVARLCRARSVHSARTGSTDATMTHRVDDCLKEGGCEFVYRPER